MMERMLMRGPSGAALAHAIYLVAIATEVVAKIQKERLRKLQNYTVSKMSV